MKINQCFFFFQSTEVWMHCQSRGWGAYGSPRLKRKTVMMVMMMKNCKLGFIMLKIKRIN